MAETQPKRPRDEPTLLDDPKRHRPYTAILNLLDDAEDGGAADDLLNPSQDLSAIFSTLQQEIFTPSAAAPEQAPADDDNAVKSVIRHLLEASDDELGIPNMTTDGEDHHSNINNNNNNNNNHNNNKSEILNSSGGDFPYEFDGLWELEDEAANYFTALQSELLM